MDKIISFLTKSNLIPAIYSLALLLSWFSTIVVKLFFKKDLISMFIEKESIVKTRVALIVFISILVIGKSIEYDKIFQPYLFLLLIPVGYETIFFGLRIVIKFRNLKSKKKLTEKLCNEIQSRYKWESGDFFIFPNSQTSELWASSQALYGSLEACAIQDPVGLKKFTNKLSKDGNSDRYNFNNTHSTKYKLIPNLWTTLTLIKIIEKIPVEILGKSHLGTVRKMVIQALSAILELQLSNNGWAPTSDKRSSSDYRLHPTVLTLWVLSEIIANNSKFNLSDKNIVRILNIINISLYRIMENYDRKNNWWSNAPYEEAGRFVGNNSLSLYIYSLLVLTMNNLEEKNFSNKESLSLFLKENHKVMIKKVDNCLLKNIEDNDTDGPYDHAVNFNSKSLSITFYDWLPLVVLVINCTKLNYTYRRLDVFREKRIFNILKSQDENIKNWYTYRLAMLLIGLTIVKNNK